MSKLLTIHNCLSCPHMVLHNMCENSELKTNSKFNSNNFYYGVGIRSDCPLKDVNPLNTFEQFIESYKLDANFKKDRFEIRDYGGQRIFTIEMTSGRKFVIAFSIEDGHIQWHDIEVDF